MISIKINQVKEGSLLETAGKEVTQLASKVMFLSFLLFFIIVAGMLHAAVHFQILSKK